MFNNLKVGDLVLCNGYQGSVTALCQWSDSMIEVRLGSGLVCVDSFDVKKV
jgi:hypothetical protein